MDVQSPQDESGDKDPPPEDVIYAILKSTRRRMTIEYLTNEEPPVSLRGLTETLAAKENDTSKEKLSLQERRQAYTGLYQVHLPKMDDVGVIEFDKELGLIDRGKTWSEFEPFVPVDIPDNYHFSVEELFGLLKDSRSRHVLQCLFDNDGVASMSTVSEYVATKEFNISRDELTEYQHKRIYVALYQRYIPKLENNDLITFGNPRPADQETIDHSNDHRNLELIRYDYLIDALINGQPAPTGLNKHLLKFQFAMKRWL